MSFDVCGPLPTGVTVLEASAGTGKTYTIAALAARYVASGVPLQQLLLVTFTRMATGELRDRVRERLVAVERELEPGAPASRDPVVQLLSQGSVEEVAVRRARLSRALADFDAATIATTHGFCQEALGSLGVSGDVERDLTVTEDIEDLLTEVVDDLYVRRFHWGDRPRFSRAQALQIARAAVFNPTASLEPSAAAADSDAAMRHRLASAVRKELEVRKRRAGLLTYDDLLTRLASALGEPGVAERLQARYRVVLVDEFQDTDPVQWEIMRRAFGTGATTLVLIGDPKQAIYAFRGADVYAYLDAAQAASTRATLAVNWRSDEGLIRAYDALFGGASLGDEGIVYRDVRAAPMHRAPRLLDAPVGAPLRVRVLRREDVALTPKRFAAGAAARQHIAKDLAADVVRLLSSGARIERRDEDGTVVGRQPVCPAHVAVLVRTNRNAALVREQLDAVGVPAVINGAGSVFGAPAALDWMRLLLALERPADPRRAHTAALTPFLGWSADRVAAAGDDEWEDVHQKLHVWARVLRERGVAALLETVGASEGLPERVLTDTAGERRLTDLRHVGQLLHATDQMGTAALVSWLRARIAAADAETGDEERSRRLESDDEAVQVLTIHRSKGLEFPIVYFPFLWEPGFIPRGEPVAYHDPAAGHARRVDVGLGGPGFEAHKRQFIVEQRGEDLRLMYVALTRACHQAVVWWAGSFESRHSALGRLLFARGADGTVAPFGAETPEDNDAIRRFMVLRDAAPGCVSLERSTLDGGGARWAGARGAPAALAAAELGRELDRDWRRTSYSDITALAHEGGRVASEPEERGLDDEPEDAVAPVATAPPADALPVLLGEGPGGTRFGTFVHRVFEAVDFAAPDLDAALSAAGASPDVATPATPARDLAAPREPASGVVAGLRAAIETPLGPLAGGRALRSFERRDRLDELGFELPLAGGDAPVGAVTPGAIAALLRAFLPAGDALHGYADRLADPDLRARVRGYLTGSIDLVLRVDDAFVVVDYKTNWLAAPGEALTTWHYRPSALAAEMQRAHYGLQALLYVTALHRYLRWRVADYDPARHLGGVLYLFVRGMTGAAAPLAGGLPAGVFAWRPPADLVVALSDLLEAGAPE
ncbi:MAG TPA: UvrD-helicase domain-containing protein [Solirubrobacter sp.]|nr:UvrD-helicase domain-containing protein [Solirubrobacter sp.]